ncbi:hypothetical protein V1505DRAFT_356063 [Lipomyces doorenjongii]
MAAPMVSRVPAANMQDRIDRLENLVTSLVSKNNDEKEVITSSGEIPHQRDTSGQSSTPQTSSAVAAETAASKEPDDFEANQLVKIYQDEMSSQSPFVIIPPRTTASDLRQESPLLYRAIIIATSGYHSCRQAFYEKQISEFVTDHLLMRSHKSLELLQSILLFIAWYRRSAIISVQLNNLLQLAVGLVVELNLNRGPTFFDRSKMVLATPCSRALTYGPKTMDERRALLGCFYLSSAAATSLQRMDSMRLTRPIEESCQALIEKQVYPTDVQLAYVVKAQYLTERIAQTIHINEWDITFTAKPPVEMHIKAFQSEITAMKNSLPPSLQQNTSALMHLDFASIRLYEVALLDTPQSPSTNPIPTKPTHLENLYSLLLSTKSFITFFLSTPAETYHSLSYITWAQFAYALMILTRLTFFTSPSCPSWTIEIVRSIMDFSVVQDTLVARFEQARAHTMTQGENRAEREELYNGYIRKLHKARALFENRVKFEKSANAGWEQDKVRVMGPFEGKNRDVERGDGHPTPSTSNSGAMELMDDEMQLDPSLFDALNDDALNDNALWLDLATY